MDRLGVWDGDVLSLRGHRLASSLLKAPGPLYLFCLSLLARANSQETVT